jgi:3-carboxy-cis,cis-muconate cycloisomerase
LSSDELFGPLFVPAALREAVSGRAWVEAMLAAELALARATLPAEEAERVAAACDASRYDLGRLAEEGRRVANPAEPLARALREASGVDAAHRGATSQDIVDTAAMLVARAARELIAAELDGLARACAGHADAHRGVVMAARTLLQQAVPTTFGLVAAGWLAGALDARRRLLAVELPAQLGGAAGTLALLGERGPDVLAAYAEELGLAEPVLPWHASRGPVLELAAALGVVASAAAKVGIDVVLLAQTEVGEVRMRDAGGSSTMPHKRNPAAAVMARACARRVHALVTTFTGEHELQRAAGPWQAEWAALSDALALTGAAAGWARQAVEGLEPDPERMGANLRPEALSEAPDGVREPDEYLGAADAFVERALDRYRRELG